MTRAVTVSLGLLLIVRATVPATAGQATDEKALHAFVTRMWEDIGNHAFDRAVVHPDGALQATSLGGFWTYQTREELEAQINDSPNTLILEPHHIRVEFVGAKEDVAYVTYYLTGRIEFGDGSSVVDYRTRASMVMVKHKGDWVLEASHYSPLFGGSGVPHQ